MKTIRCVVCDDPAPVETGLCPPCAKARKKYYAWVDAGSPRCIECGRQIMLGKNTLARRTARLEAGESVESLQVSFCGATVCRERRKAKIAIASRRTG